MGGRTAAVVAYSATSLTAAVAAMWRELMSAAVVSTFYACTRALHHESFNSQRQHVVRRQPLLQHGYAALLASEPCHTGMSAQLAGTYATLSALHAVRRLLSATTPQRGGVAMPTSWLWTATAGRRRQTSITPTRASRQAVRQYNSIANQRCRKSVKVSRSVVVCCEQSSCRQAFACHRVGCYNAHCTISRRRADEETRTECGVGTGRYIAPTNVAAPRHTHGS